MARRRVDDGAERREALEREQARLQTELQRIRGLLRGLDELLGGLESLS